ncbi:MAG: peroxiredoxin [Rubrobacteraceae bacterium]
MTLPEEGQLFPDVRFTAEDGGVLAARDLEGRKTVLYFYPKDDTPGCTKEACAFRDRMDDYRREGIGVYGVSVDSAESHREFREQHRLNFPLLTDKGGEAAAKLGVLNEQGRARRTTFLLGGEGRIERVYPEVSPETHADEILEDARELSGEL